MPQPHDELDFAQTLRGGGQPTLLGRYRVVRELGHGGMGSVYLAEDTQLDGRLVAIKMPSAILARNKRAVADLKREATTAMQLSHPAIVTLRSFEQSDDGVFLVMDYVEGETLEDRLADKGTLTPEEVVALLKPVAEALDYAHERRVVHRDLKPANILIDNDGRAHLTDFGIAREMKDTMTRVTGRQDTSGTLPYMSPEQVHGENPSPAQDLYSFGAMLYECLAGHPPFFRGQVEHQILNKPADASALPAGPLAKQVMACLAKSADDRPGKAAAVFDATGHATPTTSRASGGREGADPHARQDPAQGPLPDGRGSSEAFQQFAEVFDDMFGKPPQGKLPPGERSRSHPPQTHTTPPADPAAKPWGRAPEPFAAPPAPAPATPAAPAPAVRTKPDAAPEEESGCLAGLVALFLVAAFFTTVIWAALQAPGWQGVVYATLVGLPSGLVLYLIYGRQNPEAGKSSMITETIFCTVVACLTGAAVVNFDAIKAWGLSVLGIGVSTPVVDFSNQADSLSMVGDSYFADLGNGMSLELTYIPATSEIPATNRGGFSMGCPGTEPERGEDENMHQVVLSNSFLMGVTEVTQSQWEAVMGSDLAHHQAKRSIESEDITTSGADYPMYYVSWHEAVSFCERLTALERDTGRLPAGWSYRLPTEAEWEWACRSESYDLYHSGTEESDLSNAGWYNRNSLGPNPVRQKLANAWGLYDMHGNVLEWCSDWYGPYREGRVYNPTGPANGNERVMRGGGWRSIAKYCRTARRSGVAPDFCGSNHGFRVVLSKAN